jgi:CMP-N,N'-diacetyllegionaminic acid synthase
LKSESTKPYILGLITARGGSKGIPGKNITLVNGKPLIAWTIETALKSTSLSRVIVSTDDEEIARISLDCSAEVPFLRPKELAQDDSPHIPVIVHAIEWLESNSNERPDYVFLLEPTSPFRTVEDIENATRLVREKKADSVVGVCKAPSHPYFAKQITQDGRLENYGYRPEGYLYRQILPPVYVINGAVYLVRRDVIVEKNVLITENTYAYLMPAERSLNIDEPWDMYLADLIFRDRNRFKDS